MKGSAPLFGQMVKELNMAEVSRFYKEGCARPSPSLQHRFGIH